MPPKKAEPPAPKEEPAPAPAGEEGQEGGTGPRFEARLAEALRDAQVKFLKVRAGRVACLPGSACRLTLVRQGLLLFARALLVFDTAERAASCSLVARTSNVTPRRSGSRTRSCRWVLLTTATVQCVP